MLTGPKCYLVQTRLYNAWVNYGNSHDGMVPWIAEVFLACDGNLRRRPSSTLLKSLTPRVGEWQKAKNGLWTNYVGNLVPRRFPFCYHIHVLTCFLSKRNSKRLTMNHNDWYTVITRSRGWYKRDKKEVTIIACIAGVKQGRGSRGGEKGRGIGARVYLWVIVAWTKNTQIYCSLYAFHH